MIAMRQMVEREIAEQVIKDALAAGYVVGVFDGEEETVKGTDFDELAKALMTTDEDWVTIYPSGDESPINTGFERGSETARIGWVRLIYGNDGWDVVSDYTTNLEPIMANADALAKYFEADKLAADRMHIGNTPTCEDCGQDIDHCECGDDL